MLIPQAYAQAAGQPPQGGGLFLPLMMVGILLFMYFTTIRPQRKRQKEHAAMVSALKKGTKSRSPRACWARLAAWMTTIWFSRSVATLS